MGSVFVNGIEQEEAGQSTGPVTITDWMLRCEKAERERDEAEKLNGRLRDAFCPCIKHEPCTPMRGACTIAEELAALKSRSEGRVEPPPPETDWTSTPPTEPGWYWRIDRERPGFPRVPCKVFEAESRLFVHDGVVGLLSECDFLWWSVPIPEPPVPIEPPRRETR